MVPGTTPHIYQLIKDKVGQARTAGIHREDRGMTKTSAITLEDIGWNAAFEKLMLELAQVSAEIRKKS